MELYFSYLGHNMRQGKNEYWCADKSDTKNFDFFGTAEYVLFNKFVKMTDPVHLTSSDFGLTKKRGRLPMKDYIHNQFSQNMYEIFYQRKKIFDLQASFFNIYNILLYDDLFVVFVGGVTQMYGIVLLGKDLSFRGSYSRNNGCIPTPDTARLSIIFDNLNLGGS